MTKRFRPAPSGRTRRRRGRGERGQGLAETALVLPLFLIILVGVVEVTNAMNAYVTLVSASRDGARLGSKGLATDAEIKNLVVIETDRLRDDPDPVADITVTHAGTTDNERVQVEVCTDYTSLLNIPLVMPSSFRMCASTTMREFPPT